MELEHQRCRIQWQVNLIKMHSSQVLAETNLLETELTKVPQVQLRLKKEEQSFNEQLHKSSNFTNIWGLKKR